MSSEAAGLYVHIDSCDPQARLMAETYFNGRTVLDVGRIENRRVGNCYQNVLQKIALDGGERAYGWQLALSPGRFVKALHHCVWRSPSGELFDVTAPPFPFMSGATSTFILDDSEPFPPDDFDPAVPSVFHLLTRSSIVQRFCNATRSRTIRVREMAQLVRKYKMEVVRTAQGPAIMDAKGHERELEMLNGAVLREGETKQRLEHELLQFSEQPRHDRCACGSGKKYMYCHGS